MNINLSVTASPIVLGNTFVVTLAATSAPNTILQTFVSNGPYLDSGGHQIPFQVVFPNVTAQLYDVTLWETSNGTASGRIENKFTILVSADNGITNIRADEFIKGGVTAGFPVGATSFSAPTWLKWDWRLVKEGYGPLEPGIDYIQDTINGGFSGLSPIQQGEVLAVQFQPQNAGATIRKDVFLTVNTSPNLGSGTSSYVDSTLLGQLYSLYEIGYGPLEPNVNYTQDITGGWTLIGRQFQDGQKFVETFHPNFSQHSSYQSPFSGTLVVTKNVALTNADCGKAILIMGASTYLTITLPLLATCSDFQSLNFNSCGGKHINVSIITVGTDGIQRKLPVNEVVLGQDEQFKIYKALGNWQVDFISPTVDMVGQIIYSYDKNEEGCIQALGQLVARSDYRRLFLKAFSLPDSVVDDGLWYATSNNIYINKGNYSRGTNGSDLRLPDLTNTGILRVVDGNTRLAASFQAQNVAKHDHVTHGEGAINGRYLTNTNSRYSGGGGDSFGGMAVTPDVNFRTGMNGQDAENRMANTAVYALIRI